MLRGLYTAASGMITETYRTDTISNNLANIDTTGYKKDTLVNEEFAPILLRRINDSAGGSDVTSFKGFSTGAQAPVVGRLGRGSLVSEVATSMAQGSVRKTDNPLDLALSGPGYFVVNTAQGQRYTRNGTFTRSARGQMIDGDGHAVLDVNNRPITLPENTAVRISEDGRIFSGQDEIAQLRLVNFTDRRALEKEGSSLYRIRTNAQPQPATGASVMQGALEASNVNSVSEMVALITNYRTYEADSKALMSQDAILEKAVTEVGKV